MSNMWNSVVGLKDTLPREVQFVAGAIVIGALLAYWFVFQPKAVKLQRATYPSLSATYSESMNRSGTLD